MLLGLDGAPRSKLLADVATTWCPYWGQQSCIQLQAHRVAVSEIFSTRAGPDSAYSGGDVLGFLTKGGAILPGEAPIFSVLGGPGAIVVFLVPGC